jgi:hypothetical protein
MVRDFKKSTVKAARGRKLSSPVWSAPFSSKAEQQISEKRKSFFHAIDHCSRLSTGNVCSPGALQKVTEPSATTFFRQEIHQAIIADRHNPDHICSAEFAGDFSSGTAAVWVVG